MPNKNQETETVTHEIEPVWNRESKILILGTMPSPKSREAGFFYMHPRNRFWQVLPEIFDEQFKYANDAPNKDEAICERKEFLLRHHIALWDVLASCDIHGAADSSIQNAKLNDFSEIFEKTRIQQVFCTGKKAFNLWKKHCASEYKERLGVTAECLPSTSPANVRCSLEQLIEAYKVIRGKTSK